MTLSPLMSRQTLDADSIAPDPRKVAPQPRDWIASKSHILHAAATEFDLYGDHAGQAAARADRAEEGIGHSSPQRPTAAAILGAPLQLKK